MHKAILEAVGLRTEFDIPAGILFSRELEPEWYGLRQEDRQTIALLRDFVEEYNRETPPDTRTPVTSSRQAAEMLYPALRSLDHEEVWCLFLTRAHLPISRKMICSGALDVSVIDARKIIRTALEENATDVILFHNHPSGNPMPSQADIRQTEKLKKAMAIFDISFTDHIIISESRFFSFAEDSLLCYSAKN